MYSATKAAVRNLTRTLAAELIERNIRVNSIAAGPVETPIFEKMGFPEEVVANLKENFRDATPMKRIGSSDEIATVAVFLASSDSSFMTGTDIP